jgi:signal transduction histidine kinase/CheY-like chemotaxis protein
VRVSLRALEDARIQLRVTDSGIGIAPEDVPRVFERFHRVQGARGRTQEGSGIGLALVYELVKLHGGSVSLESDVGRGSTFTLTLPTGWGHLPAERIGQPRTLISSALSAQPFLEEALRWLPGAGLGGEGSGPIVSNGRDDVVPPVGNGDARVLVVDDNADMRDYLSRLLTPQYDVEAVGDAASAIEAMSRQAPNLVLSDVMLPGRDGLELLRIIRSNPTTATVPVVLLSARAGDEAKVEGLRTGADDYLVKPFSARELLARVESHLRLAALRAEVDAERERRLELERSSREALERVHAQLVVRDAVGAVLVDASLEDGPARMLDEICRGFRWDWGVFWEVDADGSALRPITTWALPGLDIAAFEDATRAISLERGQGLPGRAWETERPVPVGDVRRRTVFARRGAAVASCLRAGIELPVRSGGRVVGVLELMSRERREVDAEMLATLEAIGAKVGQFVERRRADAVLRRSEAAERSARLAAEAAVHARDEFVATISHDLSNPLSTIKGHVQLLRRSIRRAAAPEAAQLDARLATMEVTAADMERLIRDLLDAAQLEAGRPLDLRREPADLVTLASRCVAAYEKLADGHRLRLLVNAPAATGLWDVSRVERVVANLLANAIKYSPAGGEVVVSIDVNSESAVLTVRDEGLGIPATDLPHIFERFHRGSNVERISGTGIGLASAKDIVERHGGTISVTSVEGQGTTVAVHLPLASTPKVV